MNDIHPKKHRASKKSKNSNHPSPSTYSTFSTGGESRGQSGRSAVKNVAAVSRSGLRLFYFESTIPYTRRNGIETKLAIWRGHCRQCGEAFTIATPMPGEDGRMTGKAFERVHCDAHKRRTR